MVLDVFKDRVLDEVTNALPTSQRSPDLGLTDFVCDPFWDDADIFLQVKDKLFFCLIFK
jgi:hypothetical protein